jgi:hypothetical protein
MSDDRPMPDVTEVERQACTLAALLDAAAGELERDGPVPPTELQRRLAALEAEWAGERQDDQPTRNEADRRSR